MKEFHGDNFIEVLNNQCEKATSRAIRGPAFFWR
jgi:hypothetical protein